MSEKRKKKMFGPPAMVHLDDEKQRLFRPSPNSTLPIYVPPVPVPANAYHVDAPNEAAPAPHRINVAIQKLPPRTQLVILLMILGIIILAGVILLWLALSYDTHHADVRELVMSRADEHAIQLLDEMPVTRASLSFYYDFQLGDAIQEWQTFPDTRTPLPFLNVTLEQLVSFDVCCRKHDSELDAELYVCSNGISFDVYSFEARIKTLRDAGLQCIVYLNSPHLTNAMCSLALHMLI